MKTKHTEGPWLIEEGEDDDKEMIIGEGFKVIGGCGCCGSPWVNGATRAIARSNALLLVAAPALLEALLDMVSDHESLSPATLAFARAAIAKAIGA